MEMRTEWVRCGYGIHGPEYTDEYVCECGERSSIPECTRCKQKEKKMLINKWQVKFNFDGELLCRKFEDEKDARELFRKMSEFNHSTDTWIERIVEEKEEPYEEGPVRNWTIFDLATSHDCIIGDCRCPEIDECKKNLDDFIDELSDAGIKLQEENKTLWGMVRFLISKELESGVKAPQEPPRDKEKPDAPPPPKKNHSVFHHETLKSQEGVINVFSDGFLMQSECGLCGGTWLGERQCDCTDRAQHLPYDDAEFVAYCYRAVQYGCPGLSPSDEVRLVEISSGLNVEKISRCKSCNGEGSKLMAALSSGRHYIKCHDCKGTGYVEINQ